jgi:hypothetical protein
MASLVTIFREMPDPRRGDVQRRESLVILTIAPLAAACGAEKCVDSAEFAERREPSAATRSCGNLRALRTAC